MIDYIFEWLSLLLRWLHVITAIAWIGASFYFVWLDNSLETPPITKREKGVRGELWAFHGGGIYEVSKYFLAPEKMPKTLHWFKWEAYSTWISGTLLLCAVYYFRAELYLVGPWQLSPILTVFASVGFIAFGLLYYEVLFRWFGGKGRAFIFLLILYIAFSCWLATQLFSGRAAFLHVGAMLATIMAGNVFLGIMPAQRSFIRILSDGKTPGEQRMLQAKLRSVHNNYFTLPVIFCMISNHYAFLYQHTYSWLILVCILAISAYARHFFNLRHRGEIKPKILFFASIAVCLLAALMVWLDSKPGDFTNEPAHIAAASPQSELGESDQKVLNIVSVHCANCHAIQPTQAGFSAPPAGIVLENMTQIAAAKNKIVDAVSSNYMPLGNMTAMSDDERTQLISLLSNDE